MESPACENRASSTANKRSWAGKSIAVLAVLLISSVACSQGDLSTWNPAGPVAEKQLLLFNVLVWVMVVVFVLVEGALLYAIIRYRRRPDQPRPVQVHGHLPLEIAWTIIPTILIMGLGVWSVMAVFEINDPPSSADYVLEVTVTGHQWWWEFEYPDAGGGKTITTASELRVPVDTPVRLKLESDDVIHSFWVPRLAGKVDVIPTHTNTMWFQADSDKIETLPATFHGVCAEFCGTSHALMKFRVEVLEQADYDAWVDGYGEPPALSPKAQQGQAVFAGNCTSCHTATGADIPAIVDGRVAGFLAGGNIAPAPNLTDLATRKTIASGLLDLNEENLGKWLQDPLATKPGNYMARRAPFYQEGKLTLSTDDVSAVIEYLLSLK
ncbi:MAG: cytochrome c oxidase subunit II [SAR202 cluster bacterium Io17-Chloro-G9]|nr:MAG: cytochrome c oxidase subunit II [SAR202 cluster bacterium Io17-Chloro-G9]